MEEIFERAQLLLDKVEKISKFGSKYHAQPNEELRKTQHELQALEGSLNEVKTPHSQEELFLSELKSRLQGLAHSIETGLSGTWPDFKTILLLYGIPEEDITALRPWLEGNKESTLASVESLFLESDVQSYELGLPTDLPRVRRQAEEFAAVHIERYHRVLGKRLQKVTRVGEYLREIDAVPTSEGRSYFHQLTNTIAIGIPAICYMTEDGTLHIKERELLRIYGHEGMGHALHFVLTRSSTLPAFLKTDSIATTATAEAIAQHYQSQILEDLLDAPEIQDALGIRHIFPEIHQEARDISKIEAYRVRFMQYALTILADKTFGNSLDPETIKKRIEKLSEVAIDPHAPKYIVEQYKHRYDSDGNFDPSAITELRYCAQPVQRAVGEFAMRSIQYEGEGRNLIDATLLHGFWTPRGYVHHARLVAEGKISVNGN